MTVQRDHRHEPPTQPVAEAGTSPEQATPGAPIAGGHVPAVHADPPPGHGRTASELAYDAGDAGEDVAELATLTADQRRYYEQQRRQDPGGSRAEALANARSSRPLTAADQDAVIAAQRKLASVKPRPIDPHHNHRQVQIEITFDGTWNDRDEMAFDTNPALIGNLFEGAKQYEKGVGTDAETKLVGGAFGAGLSARIDHAYTNLVTTINTIKQGNPQAEIVLVITGFSRGSTAARAFANELNHRGVPDTSSPKRERGGYSRAFEAPRIGVMILYDTVGSVAVPGTNLNPGLDLSIPANAENVLHLTAADEKRAMFPLSSANDPARPDDPRITELALPGAHSDVGGSYPNRYSRIPLHMAHDYMARAGVAVKPMNDEMPDAHDPDLRLHDSGGDSERTVYPSTNPEPYPVLTHGR